MSNSRDTKVLIEVTRSRSSISENQKHILLLAVSLFGQAHLQYRKLHVLQCVIGLVEVIMYRKVDISPVYDVSAVFSETVRQLASTLSNVDLSMDI